MQVPMLAAIAFAAVTAPAPAPARQPEVKKDVIIKRVGPDGREVRVEGEELKNLVARCEASERAESDVTAGEGKDRFRTRVVICGDKGATGAETRRKLAEALERAKDELGGKLSPERRAEAAAALDREIARLREQDGK